MKGMEAKEIVNKEIKNLCTELKEGKSDAIKEYLSTLAKFPNYSFRNCMLIAKQKPDATRVAGFRAWKGLNRYVKKGEHAITIIAPMPFKKEEGEEKREGMYFKAAYVFDVSQTDGEPLPEPTRVTGEATMYLEKLKNFATNQEIAISYADDLGGAEGVSTGGRIMLKEGLTKPEEIATLSHELAHEILHQQSKEERAPKVARETEAEAVAYVVCSALQLNTNRASSDYIQLYSGSEETVLASLNNIQRAASEMIEAIKGDS